MADDNTIRVGISADASALKSGMAEAVSVNKASLDQLKADYASAAAAVNTATQNLASAQAQVGKAAAAGNAEASSIIKQYEAELAKVAAAQQQAAASTAAFNAALVQEAVAASQATVAETEHAGSLRRVMTATTEARYAAQLLGRELGVPLPRALSSIAAQSQALGPVFTAAFPVAVASFMGLELGKLIVKGYDLYDNWMNLRQASEAFGAAATKVFEDIEHRVDATNRATEEYLRLTQTASAADQFKISVGGTQSIDISKMIDQKKLTELSEQAQKSIAKAFAPATMKEAGDRVTEITDRLQHLKALMDDYTPVLGRTKQDLQAETDDLNLAALEWKAITDEYVAQNKTMWAQLHHDQVEEANKAAQELAQIYRQKEAEVRKANQDAMTDLETAATQQGVTGRALTLEKIAQLAQEISAEQAYVDVIRSLKSEEVKLQEDAARQGEASYEKAQRLAKESADKLIEQTKKANAAEAKLFEEHLRAKIKASEEIVKLDEARLTAGTEANIGNLQMQKTATQAQYQLSGPSFGTGKEAEELKAIQAIDEKIIQQHIDLQKSLAAIGSAGGDTAKAQDQLKHLYDYERQLGQLKIQDNANVTLKMRQQYDQFFNTMDAGFKRSVDSWIQTGRGFTGGMQNLGTQMVSNFANNLIEMGVKWLQHETMTLLAHIAGNEAKVAADASATVQTGSIRFIETFKTINADAVKAASGAYASTVDIPIVGPVLAPIAAGAAYAAVEALGTLASFETGGIVPATGLAMVHQGEGVLTAPATNLLLNLAKQNAAAPNAGNNVVIHANQTYNGMSDSAFQQMLTKNAGHVLRTVKTGLRKANLA